MRHGMAQQEKCSVGRRNGAVSKATQFLIKLIKETKIFVLIVKGKEKKHSTHERRSFPTLRFRKKDRKKSKGEQESAKSLGNGK